MGVILNDGSTIRLHNWSRAHDRYTVLTFKLFWLLGWKSWRYGAGIAAVYHSHRESTSPSQVDEVFMKFLAGRWPHVGHLIFTPDRDYQFWMVAE